MEKSKADLESVVNSQREQLTRYEKRLKDVVTAYKGLLKEKEALETSLAACVKVEAKEDTATSEAAPSEGSASESRRTSKDSTTTESPVDGPDGGHLQTQILTLMNSLATLSAEKSRMEASFQADKKQLRAQLAQKDQSMNELRAQMKESQEQAQQDLRAMKAKWVGECQEREKETNNQMLMIRELQKLYADERHLKENIEMQLNSFKTQFASSETERSRLQEVQQELREARDQLRDVAPTAGQGDELAESVALLRHLQQEMQQMKEQHAVAIKDEQRRVQYAEEQSRTQAALHEDRVANLEARLAELSGTVGRYDRLRQQDQDSIQALKRKLQELAQASNGGGGAEPQQRQRHLGSGSQDIAAIVDEIVRLKKLLIAENERSTNPVNILDVFAGAGTASDHAQCQEELLRVQAQAAAATKAQVAQLQERLAAQGTHIVTLQDKVKVLNGNIEEQEAELKQQAERQRQAVRAERLKWQDALHDMEKECRGRVNDVEQQLQKQRQRSLQLIDEKEQEIKTLQTSFDIFHNVAAQSMTQSTAAETNAAATSSDAESIDGADRRHMTIRPQRLSMGENCHMLHYANEIARKDIEIASLRRAKYTAETSLRKSIQEKVQAQEELHDRIASLEEQIDRLERCQTREGANLEYLKNVIISYLMTRDADGKRHMLNAISAVLQFTPAETQAIHASFQRK